MYPLFPQSFDAIDPVATERRESGRPATHLEILQRNRKADRHYWMAIAEREPVDEPTPSRISGPFDGIRRAISRALIQTGERIDPQAA